MSLHIPQGALELSLTFSFLFCWFSFFILHHQPAKWRVVFSCSEELRNTTSSLKTILKEREREQWCFNFQCRHLGSGGSSRLAFSMSTTSKISTTINKTPQGTTVFPAPFPPYASQWCKLEVHLLRRFPNWWISLCIRQWFTTNITRRPVSFSLGIFTKPWQHKQRFITVRTEITWAAWIIYVGKSHEHKPLAHMVKSGDG